MSRDEANELIDTGTLTFGELKARIADSRIDGVSRVNRSLTKWQALEILRKGITARPDAARVDPRSRRDVLIARNVLRECDASGLRAESPEPRG